MSHQLTLGHTKLNLQNNEIQPTTQGDNQSCQILSLEDSQFYDMKLYSNSIEAITLNLTEDIQSQNNFLRIDKESLAEKQTALISNI